MPRFQRPATRATFELELLQAPGNEGRERQREKVTEDGASLLDSWDDDIAFRVAREIMTAWPSRQMYIA